MIADRNKIVTLELELDNDDRIVRSFLLSKIYGIRQTSCKRLKFAKTFPFLKNEKTVRTYFKYQSEYETMRSADDASYCIKCNLNAFLDMLGVTVTSWDENVLRSTIRNG